MQREMNLKLWVSGGSHLFLICTLLHLNDIIYSAALVEFDSLFTDHIIQEIQLVR